MIDIRVYSEAAKNEEGRPLFGLCDINERWIEIYMGTFKPQGLFYRFLLWVFSRYFDKYFINCFITAALHEFFHILMSDAADGERLNTNAEHKIIEEMLLHATTD